MANNLLIITTILSIIGSGYLLIRLIYLKKMLLNNVYKNKVLSHDLNGALVTFRLMVDGLKEQLLENNHDRNVTPAFNLSSMCDVLEEVRQDIEKSVSKWCA